MALYVVTGYSKNNWCHKKDDDLEASVFMFFVLSNLEKYCSSNKKSIVVYSDGRG